MSSSKSQATLDSFVGIKTQKQSSLTSFFVPKKADQKENASFAKNAEEEQDEGPVVQKRKSPAKGDASAQSKRRRNVIEDSDSEDEVDDGSTKRTAAAIDTKETAKETPKDKANEKESEQDKATEEQQPALVQLKSAESKPAAKSSSSKAVNDDGKKPVTIAHASIPPPTQLMKAAGKGHFKSDKALVDSMPDSWKNGNSLPYSVVCHTLSEIEAITARLQIQQILTTLFRQILLSPNPHDLYSALYLTSNSVAPACQNVELGVGDSLLIKAIGEATGTTPAIVKEKYDSVGDLGTVAQTLKGKQKTLGGFFTVKTTASPLTADQVLAVFRDIAQTKGSKSQKWKVDHIKNLLVRATDPLETKYLIRGLQGKLRIGLAQSTVLVSFAHTMALTATPLREDRDIEMKDTEEDEIAEEKVPDEVKQFLDKSQTIEKRLEGAVNIVKKAYSEVPSYDALLEAALEVPLTDLHKACTLKPGIPVAPMLAKPTKSIQEVLKRLNGVRFTCEYKYDGERAQIHMLPDGTTKVFSRNLLDTSEKFPEVPVFVKEACRHPNDEDGDSKLEPVTSYVMDAEVVAFNDKTGQLVPFQILSTRKKTEESAESSKVRVIVQAFDLMYLNNESLLQHTLSERRDLLKKHFRSVPGKFQFATSLDHTEDGDTTILEEFLDKAVKGQCEGLMVKTLDVNAIYEPSRRSLNWLKLKKDYLDGLGDSVDLVPLGAYHGKGKRTGVYGAYLLACYDTDTEEFQSVCKIGTGFSEEDLKNLADGLNKHIIPAKTSQYSVSDQLECDVWFDAVQVWEVKAADLSKSSAHRGAEGKTGEAGRGIGLRFPRFERLREDKRPDEATSSDQILEMYYQQDSVVGGGEDDGDDDGI